MKLTKIESLFALGTFICCAVCILWFVSGYEIDFLKRSKDSDLPLPAYTELESKVCINTASEQELVLVEGITPDMAKAIVAYRNITPFLSFDQLLNIEGVNENILAQIKNQTILVK